MAYHTDRPRDKAMNPRQQHEQATMAKRELLAQSGLGGRDDVDIDALDDADIRALAESHYGDSLLALPFSATMAAPNQPAYTGTPTTLPVTSDVLGSYTGLPLETDAPVQDQDDLL